MDILSKLDMYKYSADEISDMMSVLEAAVFFDTDIEVLNEGIGSLGDMVKGIGNAIGITAHKDTEGFAQLTMKAGANIVKLIWYAAKAVKGDAEAKAKVKELASTEIKKEDVLDYLLKLDALSLHMISGPIHMLDALTGWDIMVKMKKHAMTMHDRAVAAIKNLVDAAKEIEQPDAKTKVKGLVHGIIRLFGLEDQQALAKGL